MSQTFMYSTAQISEHSWEEKYTEESEDSCIQH